jgi:hypothetical protein
VLSGVEFCIRLPSCVRTTPQRHRPRCMSSCWLVSVVASGSFTQFDASGSRSRTRHLECDALRQFCFLWRSTPGNFGWCAAVDHHSFAERRPTTDGCPYEHHVRSLCAARHGGRNNGRKLYREDRRLNAFSPEPVDELSDSKEQIRPTAWQPCRCWTALQMSLNPHEWEITFRKASYKPSRYC